MSAEIPTIREEDISSLKGHEEEAGESLDIGGLARRCTAEIEKNYTALKELPSSFNRRMKDELVKYITNSPTRFDKDENRGLSRMEFSKFRQAMIEKVVKVVEAYAPTEEQIKAKKETAEKMTSVKKAAEKIRVVDFDQIKDDPGDIPDLPTLSVRYRDFEEWNVFLQEKSQQTMENIGAFQKQHHEFTMARNGLQAYKKFGEYFGGSTLQLKAMEQSRREVEEAIERNMEKLKEAQKKLDQYAKKMSKASNRQKEEKMKERDEFLEKIDKNKNLSDEEKTARKKTYDRLNQQKEVLEARKGDLTAYARQLEATRQQDFKSNQEAFKARHSELGNCTTILRSAVADVDDALENPNLSEPERQMLLNTRADIAQKFSDVSFGTKVLAMAMAKQQEEINTLSPQQVQLANDTYMIDSHLETQIKPGIDTLSGHI